MAQMMKKYQTSECDWLFDEKSGDANLAVVQLGKILMSLVYIQTKDFILHKLIK